MNGKNANIFLFLVEKRGSECKFLKSDQNQKINNNNTIIPKSPKRTNKGKGKIQR